MDRLSSLLTDYLLRNRVIKEKDYEIYKYGLLSGMEMLICIITCYLAAAKIGVIANCTLLFAVFFPLRSFVGGFHMNNFKTCYICSCTVIIFTLIAIQNYTIPKSYSFSISIIEIIVIFLLRPVENINRPVNDNEKKIFLKRIRFILSIIFLIIIFCYSLDLTSFLDTITYALGIVFVSMLLGNIKNKIEQREG